MLIVLCFFQMAKKFTRFNHNKWAAQARFEVLQTRPEENPRKVCLNTLEAVGQIDRFNNLVTGLLRVKQSHLMKKGLNARDEESTGGLCELPQNLRQSAWSQIGEGAYNPSQTKSS
ncbi:hypothetical protein Hanom_Chr01g00052711 [Helianthus anomalus]